MKLFTRILFLFLSVINIAFCAITAFGFVWYAIPATQTTKLGLAIKSVFSDKFLFWAILCSAVTFILITVLDLTLNRDGKAKTRNFFIHLNSWILCLITASLAVATFAMINPITTDGIAIGISKKVMIGVILIFLIVFHIFSGKITRLINRKIQAYDNAKEMGIVGRSSILWVNLLKLVEIVFPEILVLLLLCLMLSWDVAGYFTILLIALVLPMLGNIVCDFITRRELIKNSKNKHDKLVVDVAKKMRSDLEV